MKRRTCIEWTLGWLCIACWLVPACGPDDVPPESQQHSIQNGSSPPAGSTFADTAVLVESNKEDPGSHLVCSAVLLTDNWAMGVQHCVPLAGKSQYVEYNTRCTKDADCSDRGAKCITATGLCGAVVKQWILNPDGDPNCSGCGDQIALFQLQTPIHSSRGPTPYSIGQPIYTGTKASLLGQKITVVGASTWPVPQMGSFKVASVSDSYTYSLNSVAGALLCGGDSGGPGYRTTGGRDYLTGVTVAGNCVPNGTTQDDVMKEAYWVDATLFSLPQSLRSPADGFAMALTAAGAVQAYLSAGTIYFSQCNSEPCDSRGLWSTAGWILQGANAAPAIAADAGGSQIFVPTYSGIYALHMADGGAFLGYTNLAGLTNSAPAASTRPNSGNPPLVEVVYTGTEGNIHYNWGRNSVFNSWSSLGKPAVGFRAAASPAIVSTDNNTVYVGVVGGDGNVWLRKGSKQPPSISWGTWSAVPGTIPSGLGSLQNIAMASYAPTRIDIIGTTSYGTSYGRMVHRIYDGDWWSAGWTYIGPGWWSSTATPFAASYSGKLGLLNVGSIGIYPNPVTAFIQRYSDW
jgi:hypothetical protein